MQVSWIDADEVRDLIAILAEPSASNSVAAPDLDSLPETPDPFGFQIIPQQAAPQRSQPAFREPPAAIPPPTEVVKLPASPPPPPSAERASHPPPAPAATETATPPSPTSTPSSAVPSQDVSEIREKLRLIRDRARAAGLLTNESSGEARTASPPVSPAPTQQFSGPIYAAPRAPEYTPGASWPSFAGITSYSSPPQQPQPPAPENVRASPEKSAVNGQVQEFTEWATRLTGSEEMFMLDDHGELFWGAPSIPELLIYAKLALNASLRSHGSSVGRPALVPQVQVAPGKELQLVSCPTAHGNITVALLNAKHVPAGSLREALALAMGRGPV